MTFICGPKGAPDDALRALAELTACCAGAAYDGPLGCTCWVTEFDQEQTPIDASLAMAAVVRDSMCADCAYRPDSPESSGDDRYVGKPDDPTAVFWCHQGMRKPLRFRHPAGVVVEASGDFYKPPSVDRGDHVAVPFKADGTPGDMCAGWAARRRLDAAAVAGLAEEAARG